MAYVKGPTSISISPNPFIDKVTITYSGCEWNGVYTPVMMNYWDSSPDGKTWSAYQYPSNPTISKNGSFTLDFSSLPVGHYVEGRLFVRSCDHRDNWYDGPTVYLRARKVAPSACKPPTAFSVNSTVSEGEATLSWSGAKAGETNPISGYELQFSDSADGEAWSDWAALQTVKVTATSASVTVQPPDTRGHYRRFQIRTITANTKYFSGWKVSDNSLQRNTLPSAPTAFTAEPASYTTEDITLTWSGAAAGTSAIKQYVIQKAESADNKTWDSWQTLETVDSTESSGSIVISPTRSLDVYTLYRICTQDTLDCLSAYKQSNSVFSLGKPFAPVLAAPKNNATSYSRNPKMLIQTVAPPGAKPQTVIVKATDGATYNNVDHPDMFSVSGTATTSIKTIFTNPDTKPGSFSASVHCKTVDTGPAASRSFAVAESPFTGEIAAGAPVKAAHLLELRAAANAVRNYYGLAAFPWAQPVTAGRTNIAYWPYHILELRVAVAGVVDLLAEYGGNVKKDWLDIGRGRPRADVMKQLQDILLKL
jgi:hypothetical protein